MTRWKKSRLRGLRRGGLPLKIRGIYAGMISVVLLCFILFAIMENNLKPTIVNIAEARASLIATETIHRVLYEKVLADVNYSELVYIHKDDRQQITMLQANTVKINKIVSLANLEIKDALASLEDEVIKIPFGQTFGTQLFANYGPRISVRLSPVGTVKVTFNDELQQAGINQVRHILYLNIETTIRIVVPLATEGVSVNNRVPIAETVIVGQVPNTYLSLETGLQHR